jgi:N-acetylmuramoyl-L-alanine amidase
VLAPLGCGRDDTTPAAVSSPVTRTPEFSVSSTFSLPTYAPPPGAASATPGVPRTPAARPSELPLAGRTLVLDPGHNGGNGAHPEVIDRKVDAGGFRKECDTTGTSTDAAPGRPAYPEAAFTLDVAQRAAAVLRSRGARVVLTRTDADGIGPCIDQRAAVANRLSADAAVSIHADGGPPGGRGFHVILPGPLPGRTDAIVGPSRSLGEALHAAMLRTGEPPATYVGSDGYVVRTDLGGLDLSTVPKVFVECANMRNATDAARLVDPAFRQQVAQALADGLGDFVFGR